MDNGFDKLKQECIQHGLCVECGACAAVCPEKAIPFLQILRNPRAAAHRLEQIPPCPEFLLVIFFTDWKNLS